MSILARNEMEIEEGICQIYITQSNVIYNLNVDILLLHIHANLVFSKVYMCACLCVSYYIDYNLNYPRHGSNKDCLC